jgi:hypothetical protein
MIRGTSVILSKHESHLKSLAQLLTFPSRLNYAVLRLQARTVLGETAVAAAVDLLGKTGMWSTSPTNPNRDKAKVKAAAASPRGIATAYVIHRPAVGSRLG